MDRAHLEDRQRWAEMAEALAGLSHWRMEVGARTLRWSKNMFNLLGFEPGSVPSLDAALARIHPEDRASAYANLSASFGGSPAPNTMRIIRPDGQVRHIEGRVACEYGPSGEVIALFGSLVDITERQVAGLSLAASEAHLRLLTDHASDLILEYDAQRTIRYASPSVSRYGYSPRDLIGADIETLIHADDVLIARSLVSNILGDVPTESIQDRCYRIRTATGVPVWVEGNPTVVRDAVGAVTGVVSFLRDITERKALEVELRAAQRQAEAAAAVKAEFLANMSHELRTPLTSVLGFTHLALDQPDLTDTSRGYIGKASSAGAALLATVNDILDFSTLEAGQLQIRPEPADAQAICRDALALFEEAAAVKAVALRLVARDIPACLSIDPNRLRQLLLNLVGNAVKFSDGGEVVLTAGWVDGRLMVAIQDQGPGIALEQQGLLFRRFSQIDGSRTRRHGGTGLGLAICGGLVAAMDGTIGVESGLGQGACFFFEIAAPVADALAHEPRIRAGLAAPQVRVLVTDDHAVNRELVRAILAPLGAIVTEAKDGLEAVALAKRRPFDLILMDLRMPGMGGLEAMRAIRAGAGPNQDVPILAFSADADALGGAARRAAGFNGDLTKPLLPADLIAAVSIHARDRNTIDVVGRGPPVAAETSECW